ncbi:MAG: (2Fe-2S)-binding protein [Pseudomonadota bacterium]
MVFINGKQHNLPEDWQDEPLVSYLRDGLGLTGTKFGCGKGLCGACTVHLDGVAVRSCLVAASSARNARITTIEGLADEAGLHPVQTAWIEASVPQCGYCQPGQMMTAAALLAANANPTEDEIKQAMAGNLCRCGTYPRILQGVARAAELSGADS